MTSSYINATNWLELKIDMNLLEANKLKEMKLETVGYYIKFHRLEKGWSQMRLAKELGLSENQERYLIKDYETRGLYPPKEMSMKLAEVFGLDMKYFYDEYYEFLEVAPDVLMLYRSKVTLI